MMWPVGPIQPEYSPWGERHAAVRSDPLGHLIHRDHSAPADLLGEARRLFAEQMLAHHGVDTVGADQHVAVDLPAVGEGDLGA